MAKRKCSLKDTTLGDMLSEITDRRKNILPLAETLIEHWRYDLFARRPGPALMEGGALKPTDLDLACFLAALVERKAVINLPSYKSRRGSTKKKGEHIISKENRHGNILGVTSNKKVFSFGILMMDQNVMTTDENDNQTTGAFRNYLMVDLNGEWYEGWQTLDFVPTAKENDWLNDKKLWTDNKIVFKNFVHPNRWTSFFGKYYLSSKAMITRLEEEGKALRAWLKKNKPPKDKAAPGQRWSDTTERGPTKAEVVDAFEAVVDTPALRGKFRPLTSIKGAEAKLKEITSALGPLRFATRTTELAFYQNGRGRLPSWMKGVEWEDGHRVPRGKNLWFRIEVPSTKNVAIRYRIWNVTEQVAA